MTGTSRQIRKNDPLKTKDDILTVATKEFAAYGLSGGRVDAIAEKTRTSKRMIYYYFGSKEGLYLAVLEKAYRKIRNIESDLAVADMDPVKALRTIISSTFDNDENNPDFIRLVSIENIHHAMHMKQSSAINELNISIINLMTDILERGHNSGLFKRKVEPLDLHMMISAFCFFRVSNRYSFGTIFKCDLSEPSIYQRHKDMISDAVVSYLTTDPRH